MAQGQPDKHIPVLCNQKKLENQMVRKKHKEKQNFCAVSIHTQE
jgi:hypothetical protein